MHDAERVLNLLIHDIRTPLGVAQGYLRLMKDQHLQAPDDVQRALEKAMKALGGISRLCEDATAFLPHEETTRTSTQVDVLVERVDVRARERGVSLTRAGIDPRTSIAVTPNVDRLAEAVLVVLASSTAPAAYTVLTSSIQSNRALTFMAAPADRTVSPTELGMPFDPWRGPGLALARACRAIADAGGRIVTAGEPGRAVAIAFPLET